MPTKAYCWSVIEMGMMTKMSSDDNYDDHGDAEDYDDESLAKRLSKVL